MVKCLLIHPPVRQQDKPRHIPYGIGILANIIRDKHEVAICDMNIQRMNYGNTDELYEQYLRECLQAARWDFVGIGGLSSMYKDIKKILSLTRKTSPQATIMGGGGWITYIPKEMMELNPEIDIACVGESFETLPEILDGKSSRDIRSIYYREGSQLIATPPRGLYHDVDRLPYPAYDLLDMELYFKNSSSNECVESMSAKRRTDGIYEYGCPRSCRFCSHNGASRYDLVAMYGKEKVREMDKEFGFQNVARWQSPKYIVENTWFLYNNYQLDFLTNMDENMCSNRRRVFSLCDMLISEGLNKKVLWGALGDTASVDVEMLSKMKEAGCVVRGTKLSQGSNIKAVEQFTLGDNILTHTGKLQHVLRTMKRQYKGNLYKIFPFGDKPASFTEEHPVLVVDSMEYDEQRDKNLGAPDWHRRHLLRRDQKINKKHRWIPVSQLNKGMFLVYPVNQETKDNSAISKDLCRLIGYYLAEGYCKAEGIGKSKRNYISLSFHKKESEYLRDVKQIIQIVFGLQCHERTRGNVTELIAYGREIAGFFRQFGDSVYNKSLPEQFVSFPLEKQAEIVCGYWRGDGHTSDTLYRVNSVSELLIRQIKEILLRFGIVGCFYIIHRKSNKICGRTVNINTAYELTVGGTFRHLLSKILRTTHPRDLSIEQEHETAIVKGDYTYIPIRKIETSRHNGYVYNLEVAEDNSYCLDSTITAHNCRYISYGGESASNRILLKDIGKGVTREHAQYAVDCMKKVQMRPLMTFQIGFPSETIDDILETTHFFLVNNIHSDCFIDTAYPGTQYFIKHRRFLLSQYDPLIEVCPDDKEREARALERMLIDFDDATDMSATVSQHFNQVELLGLKALVANNDMRRILLFAHQTNRPHAAKWNEWCDTCSQTKAMIVGN